MYCHIELLPESVPIEYVATKDRNVPIQQFDAGSSSMRQLTSGLVTEQSLDSYAPVKGVLSRANSFFEQALVFPVS